MPRAVLPGLRRRPATPTPEDRGQSRDPLGQSRRRIAAVATLAVLASACREAAETAPVVALTPFATVSVPPSRNNQVALTDEATACVIDSYEVRVFCTGQTDSSVRAFGRRGDGPGEFRELSKVVGSFDGAVGVVDFELGRLQVFRPVGSELRVTETRVPGIFTPTAPLAATSIVGYRIVVSLAGVEYHHLELELPDGRATWERRYPGSLAGPDCGQEADLYPGTPLPGGGMAFSVCDGRRMAFFVNRDHDAPILVPTQTYAEELPGERDVDQYVAGLRRMFGSEPPSSQVAEYRRRPKRWYRSTTAVDGEGRLWIATNRDRDEYSYLDVYSNREYAGTVRVRSRLLGFDVRDSTLAVVAARAGGVPGSRVVDWYRVYRSSEISRITRTVSTPRSSDSR